jgi:hypothetical protein
MTRPYLTKSDVHHTLCGLAAGDEDGTSRSDGYLEALEDVREALGIDADEDAR